MSKTSARDGPRGNSWKKTEADTSEHEITGKRSLVYIKVIEAVANKKITITATNYQGESESFDIKTDNEELHALDIDCPTGFKYQKNDASIGAIIGFR